MPALKIAIQLNSLRLPFKKALQKAAELGASAVEIDARGQLRPQELSATGLRELRNLLSELDLGVSAIGFQTRRGYDSADDLERRIDATKAAMKFAYALGAPVVINQVGHVPADADSPAWQVLVPALTELSRYGLHSGALLAAQTGAESGADLARLLDALAIEGMGIDLDPGNLIVHGFSPQEAVEKLGPRILHLHARDGVRDLARGRGIEVPLGQGTADFPALLGALEEHGFRGHATIVRENADDPLGEIAQAVEFLKGLGARS